jgi:hypothetical protein
MFRMPMSALSFTAMGLLMIGSWITGVYSPGFLGFLLGTVDRSYSFSFSDFSSDFSSDSSSDFSSDLSTDFSSDYS